MYGTGTGTVISTTQLEKTNFYSEPFLTQLALEFAKGKNFKKFKCSYGTLKSQITSPIRVNRKAVLRFKICIRIASSMVSKKGKDIEISRFDRRV
jgi:hypothetical protein